MGFVFFRGTTATTAFLEEAFKRNSDLHDDQKWINMALHEMRIEWDALNQNSSHRMKSDEMRHANFGVVRANSQRGPFRLKVALLPISNVDRGCINRSKRIPGVVVEHCRTKKTGQNKMHTAYVRRLWHLEKAKSLDETKIATFIRDEFVNKIEHRHQSTVNRKAEVATGAWVKLIGAISAI
jgi:hypothetical protein